MDKLLRSIVVWLVIIAAESVHGTVRALLIEPAIGGHRARQIAVFTGALIFFLITLIFIKWINVQSAGGLLSVGALWVVLTFTFEIVLGRFVIGLSNERLFSEYDVSNGGVMPFGLLMLLVTPMAAARFRWADTK